MAQIQNSIAIVLNEFSTTNLPGGGGISDNYGRTEDWVEIYNNHTSSVTLNGYYLSNDKNNLTKWQFPSTFTLGVGQYGIVYLTGRNESKPQGGNWYHHANFTLDQCKNEWLILSTPQVAIRDSVFVMRAQAGHSWGRIDYDILGVNGWRVFTTPTFSVLNSGVNYKGYLPTPTFTPAAGWGHNGQTLDMFLNNNAVPYDGSDSTLCWQIHYTTNGCIPTPTDPVYTYTSAPCPIGGTGNLIILDNMIVRAITYPKGPLYTGPSPVPPCMTNSNYCNAGDETEWLPSFCQTNTYLSESAGMFDNFDGNFSLLALGMSCADTSWFNSPGTTEPVVHAEYFDCGNKGGKERFEAYASISRPPQESWLTKQKGFYVTIDDRRGWGCNFQDRIFDNAVLGTSSRTVFPTLHVYAGDHESLSLKNNAPVGSTAVGTGLRDVFWESLALKYNLDVNPLHMKPMILFVNGKYFGAYTFKEVYDENYEAFYKNQFKDSTFLQYCQANQDWFVCDYPGQTPCRNPQQIGISDGIFRTECYDWATSKPMNSSAFYNTLMSRLDKSSFIDWSIMNSYAMNSDMYTYNVAFAKGFSKQNNGDRWHYYLWNTPAIFNYTLTNTSGVTFPSFLTSACITHSNFINPTPYGSNGHGGILKRLMDPITGNLSFQLDYKNRYQDLLNTALKCDNILAHWDAVVSLYKKEMHYMEDPTNSPASLFCGPIAGDFDTNTVHARKQIALRCDWMRTAFAASVTCYGMHGAYPLSVDVYPTDAGKVKVNTIWLPNYKWNGQYFATQLQFRAAPTSTNYVFHHWEIKNHVTKNNAPLSLDSIAIDFNQPDDILAVFTDITNDIDMPTGFSPNGDGQNDIFKAQGSAFYTHEFEMRIWNRWGQEVFYSKDPGHGWDGYYENKQAQTGVYAYLISYKNVYNESKIKKGSVTLVR